MYEHHTSLAPAGPWGHMGPDAPAMSPARMRPDRPGAAAPLLQMAAAIAGLVAVFLPGASYEQHTPFGDVHVMATAGGSTSIGIGTEDHLRGILDGGIPTAALAVWCALVLISAGVAWVRRNSGLGALVVSAATAGVAAVQLWSLVSIVLQLDLEGAGSPEPGMAVVLLQLALAIAATVLWWRYVNRRRNA